MKTETFTERRTYGRWTETVISMTKHLNAPARLAAEIAEKISLVAGVPDGDDSSGRQKLRLATPEEVGARACNIALSLWNEFDRRGWISDIAPPRRLTQAEVDAERKKEDEEGVADLAAN